MLLVETKRDVNDEEGNAQAKSQIEHPEYKKFMMLYWEREERWMAVEYDPVQIEISWTGSGLRGLMIGY